MSDIRIQKTGETDIVEASDGRLTLSVPIQIKRRSGRKLVTLPNGETAPVRPWDVAPTSIQLALARGRDPERVLRCRDGHRIRSRLRR